MFSICSIHYMWWNPQLTGWLEKRKNEGNNFDKYIFRDKIQKDGFKTYIITTLILVGLMWLNNVGENTIQGFILVYLFLRLLV